MPLDVAAQREQEGLEPRPDPQRSFLTYRLSLDFTQEGGREREKKDIIIAIPHNASHHCLCISASQASTTEHGDNYPKSLTGPDLRAYDDKTETNIKCSLKKETQVHSGDSSYLRFKSHLWACSFNMNISREHLLLMR